MIEAVNEILANLDLFGAPILAGVLAAVSLGMLSPWIVQRHMAMAVVAVSQTAGASAALAFALVALGASLPVELVTVAGVLVASAWLFRDNPVSDDSRVALLFVSSLSVSMLIRAWLPVEAHELDAVLFGTAVLVTQASLLWLLLTAIPACIWLLWWYRGLCFALFDPVTARAHGLPVGMLRALFGAVLALLLALSSRSIGVLPAVGYAILPGIIASHCTVRLQHMTWIAALVGSVVSVLGFMIAYWLDLPVGPVQVGSMALLAALTSGLRYR